MSSSASRLKKKRRRIVAALVDSSQDDDDDDSSVEVISIQDNDNGEDDSTDDDEEEEEDSGFRKLWEDEVETEIVSTAPTKTQQGMCTQPPPGAVLAVPPPSQHRTPEGGVPRVVVSHKGQAPTPESLAMSSATQPSSAMAEAAEAHNNDWMQQHFAKSTHASSPHHHVEHDAVRHKKRSESSSRTDRKVKAAKVSLSPAKLTEPSKNKCESKVTCLEEVGAPSIKLTKANNAKSGSKTPSSITANKQEKQSKKERKKKEDSNASKKSSKASNGSATPKKAPETKPSKESKKVDLKKAPAEAKATKPVETFKITSVEMSKPADSTKAPTEGILLAAANSKSKKNLSSKAADATAAGSKAPHRKKLTFQEQVLQHMLLSCKPFTLKSLAKSLNTTETALKYVMLSLLDKRLVFKKEFATKKTTKELYWANQESTFKEVWSLLTPLADMKDAQDELKKLKKQDADLAKQLSIVTQESSNDDLDAQLRQMEQTVAGLKRKLEETNERIASHKRPPPQKTLGAPKSAALLVREQCPRRMKMRINAMRGEWKKRKDKCMDFVDQLADGMEKKVKDVVKLLDLETDEMEGVSMPPKHELDY